MSVKSDGPSVITDVFRESADDYGARRALRRPLIAGCQLACAPRRKRGGKALSGSAGAEDWASVSNAIRKRMRELKMSTAHLARETGLSETTIRYIGQPANGHNKSTLVAIAAVLRWRYDHLINILRGEPEKNVIVRRPAEANFERLLRAEVDSVKEEVTGLRDLVERIDKKIDVLAEARHLSADDTGRK
jgi:Cro/C1-type HTH DNA-binding domain